MKRPAEEEDNDDIIELPPTKKVTKAIKEESDGNVDFCVVENDNSDKSMILLSGLRSIFQKQLPNMPKEYIARLVYDKSHRAMVVVQRPFKVLGGITYKPFDGGFCEIVFCAIDTTCQVQGYGSRLMSHVKDHVWPAHRAKHFLTYADNYAIGYFKKQGFTTDITLEKSLWMGYIKDYEGGTIMQCTTIDKVKYLEASNIISAQRWSVFKKLCENTNSRTVYPGIKWKLDQTSIDPAEIPGLKEAGWVPNATYLSHRPEPRQRSPLFLFMKKLLTELQENTHSWPFVEPVAGVADYYDVIKNPMDLRTLNENIDANKYNTATEFKNDVDLIWINCRTYNEDGSTYVKCMDKRFQKVHTDPRFIKAKKDSHKVVLDDRFAHMLTSSEFGTTGGVDKLGRVQKSTVAKDLKRFYKVEEELEDEEERIDMARGEGLESSDEEEEAGFSDLNNLEPEESDVEDIPVGEETNRIACVNLDWDNVKAKDLFKVFEGFIPTRGQLKKVSIFPSEFGKERMQLEALNGPPTEVFQEEKEKVVNDEGKDFNMVALRKYQIDRMRYYYAIAEFDSVPTARAVFSACDGTEYESTANVFDLRYIPNDMVFEDVPRDFTTEAPLVYQPNDFVTQALQHSNVKLTWDAEDPERIKTTKKRFSKQDIKDMDFKSYLASESDSDDQDEELKLKYKSLLENSDDGEGDEEMEITFTPGLSEKAEALLQAKQDEKIKKNETVFEQQQRIKKEKKKAKKLVRKSLGADSGNIDSDSMSGREDLDDPFFQDAFGSDFEQDKPKQETKKKQPKKKLTKEELKTQELERQELELLLSDDDVKNHFNQRDVIKSEKKQRKQKQKQKQAKLTETQDDFKLDLEDKRFGNLLDSHEYHIDPTNPQFKKTKAMGEILAKKRNTGLKKMETKAVSVDEKNELKELVKSVKRKNTFGKGGQGKRQKN